MRGLLGSMRSGLKSLLPAPARAYLRLALETAASPADWRRRLNRLRYLRSLHASALIRHTPPVFTATITESCNLRCPSCLYLLEDPDKFTPARITVERFREVLERYGAALRGETLFLTGGEPLMHPDLPELISLGKRAGLSVRLSTNGILLAKRIGDLKGIDYVNVSADSYDEESFREYRGGTPAQFAAIREGLAALKASGIGHSVSFLLWKANLPKVGRMLAFAESVGTRLCVFHNVNPHGCETYEPLLLDDPGTRSFLNGLLARTDHSFDIQLPPVFDPAGPAFKAAKCRQPWFYFCFNCRGEVAYCCHLAHRKDIGDAFGGYDFNSKAMTDLRRDIIAGKLMPSCVWCQRRFADQEFGFFDSAARRWHLADPDALT